MASQNIVIWADYTFLQSLGQYLREDDEEVLMSPATTTRRGGGTTNTNPSASTLIRHFHVAAVAPHGPGPLSGGQMTEDWDVVEANNLHIPSHLRTALIPPTNLGTARPNPFSHPDLIQFTSGVSYDTTASMVDQIHSKYNHQSGLLQVGDVVDDNNPHRQFTANPACITNPQPDHTQHGPMMLITPIYQVPLEYLQPQYQPKHHHHSSPSPQPQLPSQPPTTTTTTATTPTNNHTANPPAEHTYTSPDQTITTTASATAQPEMVDDHQFIHPPETRPRAPKKSEEEIKSAQISIGLEDGNGEVAPPPVDETMAPLDHQPHHTPIDDDGDSSNPIPNLELDVPPSHQHQQSQQSSSPLSSSSPSLSSSTLTS